LILVDDGSPDDSAKKIESLCANNPQVTGLLLARNSGQHYATLCGIKHSSGEFVLTVDDDLQNPPDQFEKLMKPIEGGYHIAIGVPDQKEHGWFRRLSSSMMQRLVSLILGKPKDLKLSSFRCFSRKAADLISGYEGSFPYMPALMFESIPFRKITNVSFRHDKRIAGKSSYSLRKLVKLASFLLINHSMILLRMAVVVGVILAVASVVLSLYLLVMYFLYQSSVQGWTSIVILISFFSGMILITLGILGEYIGRIVKLSDDVPRYQIYKKIN